MKSVPKLAVIFATMMHYTLSDSEIMDVNVQNRQDNYREATCASHNYCDANEVMLQALREWLGLTQAQDDEWDLNDHVDAMNRAWQIAKMCEFDLSRVKAFKLQQAYTDSYSQTGEPHLAQAANDLAQISGLWLGPHDDLEWAKDHLA